MSRPIAGMFHFCSACYSFRPLTKHELFYNLPTNMTTNPCKGDVVYDISEALEIDNFSFPKAPVHFMFVITLQLLPLNEKMSM